MDPATLPPSTSTTRPSATRVPGVVVVFRGGPRSDVFACEGGKLELGRGTEGAGKLDDGRVSRRHATVAYDGERFTVTDLGSQNGTFVDGERVGERATVPLHRVVRVGDSLLVPYADITPFTRHGVRVVDGFVRGPAML